MKIIKICKVGKTYQYNGYLSLYILSSSSLDKITSYGEWYIKKLNNKKWVKIDDKKFYAIKKKYFINFFNINSKEIALQYVNSCIGVDRNTFFCLNKNEYYLTDLIGMNVYNIENKSLGKVKHIIETGSNYVLSCKYKKNKKIYLVPLINSCIIKINYDLNKIMISWPRSYFY